MNALQIFSYNETPVTFKNENGVVFISATEMAQQFGKMPKDYLKTKSAKELVSTLSARTNILPTDLVQVINGGQNYGAWKQIEVLKKSHRQFYK